MDEWIATVITALPVFLTAGWLARAAGERTARRKIRDIWRGRYR